MAMQNIKDRTLVKMLACLDRKQRKGFREYLQCRLFNTNATLVELYDRLEAKALKDKPAFLDAKGLLKGTGIAESMLGKLLSQLLGLLRDFVGLWAGRENGKAAHGMALRAWYEMGLDEKLLEREYRKMKTQFEGPPRNEMDIFHALQLESSFAHVMASRPRKDQAGLFPLHHQLLEDFYVVAKLKYLLASANAKHVFKDGIPELVAEFTPERINALPAIGWAYYQALLLLLSKEKDLEAAEAFFSFLTSEGAHFPKDEVADLYISLLNASFLGASQGDAGFERLVYLAYNEMYQQGILTGGDGLISGANFKNMVSAKTRVGAVEEAWEFIQENKQFLMEGERETVVNYTEGLVLFCENRFSEAQKTFMAIVQGSSEDMFWGMAARNMIWKTYFELYESLSFEEHEKMLNLYHSYRVFVSRNTRISDLYKRMYMNFIRVFNRLVNLEDTGFRTSTAAELKSLYVEVEEMEEIANKSWMLKAIERRIGRENGGAFG